MVHINKFETREEWAKALAEKMARQLQIDLEETGTASMALSGGRSPAPMLDHLSTLDLDWSNVSVTLVDDRWVAPNDMRSNEKLVRDHLLKNKAVNAKFIPLKTGHDTPEEGLAEIEKNLAQLSFPFSTLFLGMGDDGHTASLFPSAKPDELAQGLYPKNNEMVAALNPTEAPEPRITLTLPAIVNSKHIALFIYGDDKWNLFHEALKDGPVEDLPIRGPIRGANPPMDVYWAP